MECDDFLHVFQPVNGGVRLAVEFCQIPIAPLGGCQVGEIEYLHDCFYRAILKGFRYLSHVPDGEHSDVISCGLKTEMLQGENGTYPYPRPETDQAKPLPA